MKLNKIEPVQNVGDIQHNTCIDILLNNVDMNSIYAKEVLEVVEQELETIKHRWIFMRLPRTYCQQLNNAILSKNNKQFASRLNTFISQRILKHSIYHVMMHQELAHNLDKLIQKFEVKQ